MFATRHHPASPSASPDPAAAGGPDFDVSASRRFGVSPPDSALRTPNSEFPNPPVPGSPDPLPSRTSFYDKTTPAERQKINHAIVNHMPATYKGIYSFFNLKSKGIDYFAFYRYARKLRDRADAALVTDLVAPDAKASAQLAMRLAAHECVAALLHPEEEGSAKKLAKNERIYSHFRRQELAADRSAAIREVAQIRRASNRECTELRTQAQRDCTAMRTEAQRDMNSERIKARHDLADNRAALQRELNHERIKFQRDALQFKADCDAIRDLDNFRFKRGHPLRDDSPDPPPPAAPGCVPDAPSQNPVICSNRGQEPAAPATVGCVPDAPPAGARIPPALDAAQRCPGSRTHPLGNPFPCASDSDSCLNPNPYPHSLPASGERSESPSASEISNLKSEIPPLSDAPHGHFPDVPGVKLSMVELIPNSARFAGTGDILSHHSALRARRSAIASTRSTQHSAPSTQHSSRSSSTQHSELITHDSLPHPAFAGDAAPFGRRADGTKRSHLEYWIRLKQRCREILKMPAEDPDWPPDIRAALAIQPPELAAQRLREVLKRYPATGITPSFFAQDASAPHVDARAARCTNAGMGDMA